MQPLLYVVEGFLIRHIVHNNNSVCSAVVRRGNRTETLLSGCVPNLELDGLSVKLDGTNFLQNKSIQRNEIESRTNSREYNAKRQTYKVNTNGGNVGFSVRIICKSKQQTRLSNTGVSDEEEFEKIIAKVAKRKKASW